MAVVGLLLFWPIVFLCAVAFGVAVHAVWKRFHDHVDVPLRRVVIAEAVILAVAFALFCAATFYGANALVDWLQA